MIKEFKIFEKKSIKKNLVDQFDSDYIEKWYDENYDIDLSEVINMSSHNQIMDNFDEDKYKKDFLREYADSYDFNDFNEEDLLRYIKEKINEEKEIKILEIYNRNNYDEDDEDSVKETDYEDYILDQLDKDELREVIKDSREEDECTKWIIEDWHYNSDGIDIFDEFCGYSKKGGDYGYYKYGHFERLESEKLYDMISNYIDDDKLKSDWKDNDDFEYKKETLGNDISYNTVLQKHLLSKDVNNVIPLAKLFVKEKSQKNIGSTYTFQKNYIKKFIKEKLSDTKPNLKAKALKYLYDNFGINKKIEEEYNDYTWLISASKYNIGQ